MMKRVLIVVMTLLLCVTAGMAEGEHKGGVDRAIALYQEAAEYGHEAALEALKRLGQ